LCHACNEKKEKEKVIGIQNSFQQLFHTFSLGEGCVVGKQQNPIFS
jgi:hypothetical protein